MLVTVLVELIIDTLRLTGVGLTIGVRGGSRDGVPDHDGTEVDRASGEGIELGGVDRAVEILGG